ncbi:uncharacterized protein [Typha latifolia]|uniref:uncharacterized protein n=1 Tax=Typha latifolia TaxID=4733 RepID=UPI003C2B3543
MGSYYFGELGLGGGKSSSSKKGKKSNLDKPKQPQRGLGVAQLEQIRLQTEMAEWIPPLHCSFHCNLDMMTYSGCERRGDMQNKMRSSSTARSSHSCISPTHSYSPQILTLPLFERTIEGSDDYKSRLDDPSESMNSLTWDCDSYNTKELDLDLKL